MQRFDVHDRLCGFANAGTENVGCPAFELRFPDRDLVGMHVELLRKLRKRSIAFDGRNGHFRLESRCVVPARSWFLLTPLRVSELSDLMRGALSLRLRVSGIE